MKAIAAFFLLGLIVVAFSTDADDAANASCPSEDSENATHVPHPSNCSAFYTCFNGVAFLSICPSGLHFNPQLEVCDWPADANCIAEN